MCGIITSFLNCITCGYCFSDDTEGEGPKKPLLTEDHHRSTSTTVTQQFREPDSTEIVGGYQTPPPLQQQIHTGSSGRSLQHLKVEHGSPTVQVQDPVTSGSPPPSDKVQHRSESPTTPVQLAGESTSLKKETTSPPTTSHHAPLEKEGGSPSLVATISGEATGQKKEGGSPPPVSNPVSHENEGSPPPLIMSEEEGAPPPRLKTTRLPTRTPSASAPSLIGGFESPPVLDVDHQTSGGTVDTMEHKEKTPPSSPSRSIVQPPKSPFHTPHNSPGTKSPFHSPGSGVYDPTEQSVGWTAMGEHKSPSKFDSKTTSVEGTSETVDTEDREKKTPPSSPTPGTSAHPPKSPFHTPNNSPSGGRKSPFHSPGGGQYDPTQSVGWTAMGEHQSPSKLGSDEKKERKKGTGSDSD